MTQEIGLRGVFDVTNLDEGMAHYTSAITKANDQTEKAASTFSKGFGDMGSSVNKVAGVLTGALVGGTVVAGAALGGFAVKGIGQAIEMEKQMSTIASIMGKTKEQVAPLADEIVKLGLDPTLAVDATQAADAIQQLAKNGLTMDQIVQGAAKSTVLLANATGANFGDAASIATGAMKLFNIDAKDMNGAVSQMVAVTTNSKLTIGDYASALANGGGAATAAGVSFQDFNTTIAGTASLFAGGGDAATSFKTFISRLQPATDGAKEAMIKLGLATADGKSKFFDAKGQIKDMSEIAGLLQKGLAGLSDAQRSQALTTIFGADAMRTAVGLAAQGKEGFEKLQETMAKTDAVASAGVKMDNLASIMEITQGTIDAISLSIGQAFLPMVTKLAMAIGQFVSDHGEEFTNWFKGVAYAIEAFVNMDTADINWEDIVPGFLVDTMYAVGQGFDYFFNVVQAFMSGAVGWDFPWEDILPPSLASLAYTVSDAIKFVSDNLDSFSGALVGIGAVLASAGVYSALTGIAAAIAAINLPLVALVGAAALAGAAWNGNWFGIRDATIPIMQSIAEWITQIGYVLEAFSSGDVADINWENVAPAWLVPSLQELSGWLDTVFSAVGEWLNSTNGMSFPWDAIFPPTIANLAQIVIGAIDSVLVSLGSFASSISTYGAGALDELTNFVTGNQTSFDNVKAIWDQAVITAGTVFESLAGVASAGLTAFTTAVGPYADAAFNWIATAVTNAPAKIGEWYTALSGAISSYLPQWIDAFLDWADPALDWLADAAAQAGDKVAAWASALITSVANNLPSWVASFVDYASGAIGWLTDLAAKAGPYIGSFAGSLISSLGEHLPDWIAGFLDWVAAAIDWTAQVIAKVPGAVANIVVGFVNSINGDGKGKIAAAVLTWASAFIDWVDKSLIPKVAPAMGRVLASLIAGIGTIEVSIGQAALKIGAAIVEAIMKTDWKKVGTDLMNLVKDGLSAATNLLTGVISSTVETLKTKFTSTDWKGTGSGIMTSVKDGVTTGSGPILTAIGTFTADMKDKFDKTDWKGTGNAILTTMKAGVDAAAPIMQAGFQTIIDAINTKWTTFDWAAIGTAIITAIKDAAAAAASTLYGGFQTIIDAVKTKWTSIDWGSIGKAIIDGIAAGFDKAKQGLIDKIKSFGDLIPDWLKKSLGISSPAKVTVPIGQYIIQGLMVGMDKEAKHLQDKIYSISRAIDKGFTDANHFGDMTGTARPDLWFTDPTKQGLNTLEDFSSTFGDLVSLGKDWVGIASKLQLPKNFEAQLDMLDKQNTEMEARIKLLNLIKDHNLNPFTVIGGRNIGSMAQVDVANAILQATKQINQLTQDRLIQESKELQNRYDLEQSMSGIYEQMQLVGDYAQKPMNLFQSIRFGQLKTQFDSYATQLESLKDAYIKSGSETVKAAFFQVGNYRAEALNEMTRFLAETGNQLKNNDTLLAVYDQQLKMLDQIDKMGGDLPFFYQLYFKNADDLSKDALTSMAKLQNELANASVVALKKQVAEKALLSSLDTNWNVSGIAGSFAKSYSDAVLSPLLKHLKDAVLFEQARVDLMKQYNQALGIVKVAQQKADNLTFLNDQIELLNQVKEAGLDIKTVFANVLSGKSVLGTGANLIDLLNIANQAQQALVDKAQAQLTPQALALQAQQQALDKQKAQLDLLNRQLDIIHQGQQAGVNWEGFFDGLTVGLGASEADIMTATSRLYQKLIKQAMAELGIHSPSKVMMKIGNYMAQGLQVGFQQGFSDLRGMMSTVPVAPISNRYATVNLGGVTINSGLDEIMFEQRVKRIMERSI